MGLGLFKQLIYFFSLFFFASYGFADENRGYSHIVEKTLPAVVTVHAKMKVDQRAASDPMEDMRRELRDMFGNQFFPRDRMPEKRAPQLTQGSGFIIDPSGLIVTSRHNIVGAKEITVSMGDDGSGIKAEVVGQDSVTDLALLRIKTNKKLPFLRFGDSDKMKAGDIVIAIGSTFGLNGTVTAGIVSSTTRNIDIGGYHFDDLIQTDAALYFGNSGGPALNVNGEVIGVNFALISPGSGAVGTIGVGFAIPSNLVKSVINQLKEKGEVSHGYIGIVGQNVTQKLAEAMKLPRTSGVLVVEVSKGGGAHEAGLLPGDVILEISGKQIKGISKLKKEVGSSGIGKKVKLKVFRKGREMLINVTTHKSIEAGNSAFFSKETGISVKELSNSEKAKLNVVERGGVIVCAVERGSVSYHVGIMVGDVIQEVNGKAVKNLKDFTAALKSGNSKVATFSIMREGSRRFMYVDVAD